MNDKTAEGAIACQRGMPISGNPYGPDTMDAEDWANGWLNQQKIGLNAATAKKKSPGIGLTSALVALCIVIFIIGNFHLVKGSDIGFTMVKRETFGFAEPILDVDAITGMPSITARAKYPLGVQALQREGILESNSDQQRRIMDEIRLETEKAMRNNNIDH